MERVHRPDPVREADEQRAIRNVDLRRAKNRILRRLSEPDLPLPPPLPRTPVPRHARVRCGRCTGCKTRTCGLCEGCKHRQACTDEARNCESWQDPDDVPSSYPAREGSVASGASTFTAEKLVEDKARLEDSLRKLQHATVELITAIRDAGGGPWQGWEEMCFLW